LVQQFLHLPESGKLESGMNPETFCAVNHYGRWIKGIGEFRLTEIGQGKTRFDWYERIDAPTAILALIKPGILIAVNYSLAKFARGFNN
jgi:hypothetical protein